MRFVGTPLLTHRQQTKPEHARINILSFPKQAVNRFTSSGCLTSLQRLFIFSTVFAVLFLASQSTANAQVPSVDPDYTKDVEAWWANHPFNPESPTYIPIGEIDAPAGADSVTLKPGGDIQAAISGAPAGGRVIYLEPGTYTHNIDLVGKSHIHLIGLSDPKSATPVIIKGGISYDHAMTGPSIKIPSNISSCPLIQSYDDFNRGVNQYGKGDDSKKAYLDCFLNQVKDIYFKNLVFDGNGTAEMAFMLRGIRDMVWDNLVFQNFDDPGQYQIGLIHGNSGLDNIWCRGCDFVGSQRYAYLLDGVTGGGVVNSSFRRGFSGGGVGFFTNDDFTIDFNRNGVVDEVEQRVSKYTVVYGTTFDVGFNPITMHAKKSLIKNNSVTSDFVRFFASFYARRSSRYNDANGTPYLVYEYFGNRVVNNQVKTVDNFVEFHAYTFSEEECDPATDGCGRIGKYEIRANTVSRAKEKLVLEDNTSLMRVEGPNVVCNNTVNGDVQSSSCTPSSPPPNNPAPTDPNSSNRVFIPVVQNGLSRSAAPQDPAPQPPADPAPQPQARAYFPLGVFVASGLLGDKPQFETFLNELRARNFDSILVTNGTASKADGYLTVADQHQFNVLWQNGIELNDQWWPDTVPATIEKAREVIYPLVDLMRSKSHPSLKGNYTNDEPFLTGKDKVWLANQAFRERDPERPAFAILNGMKRVRGIFDPANDQVLVMDLYTLKSTNGPCEFNKPEQDPETRKGYDFVKYLRDATQGMPVSTPFWLILQAHSFDSLNNDGNDLRMPSVPELRAQQWMAVGEGATGIIWFMYGSNSTVVGFKDNQAIYDEITDLAGRLSSLRSTLLTLYKTPDQFTMTGMPAGTLPYASSLKSKDGSRNFVVAVNRSCSDRHLAISSGSLPGKLKDVETGQVYQYAAPIPFRAGDGKMFEVVP